MSGFGCPYKCSFCFRLVKGRRDRPVEAIRDEIKWLVSRHHVSYIQFQDELLMTSKRRVEEVCEAIAPLGIRWSCQGRCNVAAKHPEVVRTMAEAGCQFINYGIESLSQDVLDQMNKHQTPEQAHAAVEATLAAGVSPGINVLWAAPGDDLDSLRAGVDFILKYSDGAQRRTIRPVTPYPGSPLFHKAVADGLLEGAGDFWERFENSDLICVDFMGMDWGVAHAALHNANMKLLHDYHGKRMEQIGQDAVRLYTGEHDDKRWFRGWRQI
jgi:radical SAM superfamily enzyme YgiQ (UPF0313 family)